MKLCVVHIPHYCKTINNAIENCCCQHNSEKGINHSHSIISARCFKSCACHTCKVWHVKLESSDISVISRVPLWWSPSCRPLCSTTNSRTCISIVSVSYLRHWKAPLLKLKFHLYMPLRSKVSNYYFHGKRKNS